MHTLFKTGLSQTILAPFIIIPVLPYFDTNITTFYNTVHAFKKAGHLKEILTSNNKSYFDTHTGPHHHFFDLQNNRLTDIDSNSIKIKTVPKAPEGKSIKDIDVVTSIRGYGMMGGIDIKMKDKPGKAGFQTFKHCYDAGVNFKNTGDTLIIAPQFICEKKHIDEIIEKLRTGISNYSKS